MYNQGEIKTAGFEAILVLIRIIVLAGSIIVVTGVGMILALPPVVTGTLAGLVGVLTLLSSSMFEVTDFKCPHCGVSTRILSEIGTYNCSSCGGTSYISNGKTTNFKE